MINIAYDKRNIYTWNAYTLNDIYLSYIKKMESNSIFFNSTKYDALCQITILHW